MIGGISRFSIHGGRLSDRFEGYSDTLAVITAELWARLQFWTVNLCATRET